MNCTFEGCERPHKGLGLCSAHYFQFRRGQALKPLRASRFAQERDETGKVCRACDTHKPYEEFHLRATSKDGRQSKCKECQKAAQKANYEKKKAAALADG